MTELATSPSLGDVAIRLAINLGIIVVFLLGFQQFRNPQGARRGNLIAAAAMLAAAAVVLWQYPIRANAAIVIVALLAGSAIGTAVALRVTMIQIPAMVAFQHGAGGVAAFLVSFVEVLRFPAEGSAFGLASGILGLAIGAATFSGSMLAAAKLANKLPGRPTVLRGHNAILALLVLAMAAVAVLAAGAIGQAVLLATLLSVLGVLAAVLGLVFAIRIGGADMPVLISFLNATAGVAAALCGLIINNPLLVACGATVAASGSILTWVMCKAMNRSLLRVFTGPLGSAKTNGKPAAANGAKPADVAAQAVAAPAAPAIEAAPAKAPAATDDPGDSAIEACRGAKTAIFVPGYGMALAQAQFKVVQLAGLLEKRGCTVKFAIHPVAGRMPGHMNVLLAEADLSYDKLYEMDDINGEFKDTDLAIVIGACDVVNPAAIQTDDTPISGMPILNVQDARRVVVCNLDERPGYSGVPNPLYRDPKVTMLLGDAGASLDALIGGLPASA